jgi:glycosyltransferase involved in cell wall biosynthesis
MLKPQISFVIPVFNAEKDIERCLRAIQNLHYPKHVFEVLIIDNGSTDRTHQIMRELGYQFQVIPHIHVSALRNRGAMIAQGDYLAFVDADVEVKSNWLCNGLEVFQSVHVVAAGCFPSVPAEATWVQQTWDIVQRGSQYRLSIRNVPWLPSMNLIVRRDAFLAVGGFNEQLETAEDVDLCYRLANQGTIVCNPAMEAIHWGEARNLRTFWRKEIWRGKGNLKGVWSHGLRWDELPSLGYPLYTMCCVLLTIFGFYVDLGSQHILLTPLGLILLILPALVLAIRTAYLNTQPSAILKLSCLYVLYGLARAYAVIKP